MSRMSFHRRDLWLWVGCLLGPTAWFTLLTVAWYLVPGAHEYGRVTALRASAAIAALFPIIGGAIAIREIKLATGDQEFRRSAIETIDSPRAAGAKLPSTKGYCWYWTITSPPAFA